MPISSKSPATTPSIAAQVAEQTLWLISLKAEALQSRQILASVEADSDLLPSITTTPKITLASEALETLVRQAQLQPSWHEWAVEYKRATDELALSHAQYIERTQAAKKGWLFDQEVQLYAPGDPRRRRLGSDEKLPELRAFEQAVDALIALQTDRHMQSPHVEDLHAIMQLKYPHAITQPKVAPTRTPPQPKEIAKALTTLLNIRIETTLQVNPEAATPDARTAAAWRRELGRGAKALGWFTGRYLYVLEQLKNGWLEWQSHKLFGTELTQTIDDIRSPEPITPNTTDPCAKSALSNEATSPAADAPSRQQRSTQQRTRRRP